MRVLIADDHELVRETLAAFLRAEGVEAVDGAGTLDDGLDAVARNGPFDLVLLDYNMPGMLGLEGLTRMRAANDGRPVALLSGTATADLAEAALGAGAAGFVPKTLAPRSMVAAVRFMAAGEIFAPVGFLRAARERPDPFGLTPREREVLRGLVLGKANKEIANDLNLQEVTVKLHVKTLCRKLGAKNRTQAAMIARDHELL